MGGRLNCGKRYERCSTEKPNDLVIRCPWQRIWFRAGWSCDLVILRCIMYGREGKVVACNLFILHYRKKQVRRSRHTMWCLSVCHVSTGSFSWLILRFVPWYRETVILLTTSYNLQEVSFDIQSVSTHVGITSIHQRSIRSKYSIRVAIMSDNNSTNIHQRRDYGQSLHNKY